MKKNFIYLLLFFSLIAQAQVTPSYPTIKLTKTVEGVKQDSLLVVGTDKTVKHIPSSKITSVIEYTTASALPITGVAGKIYVTKDNGKIYRWNGTYYTELAITDISGKVDKIVGKGLSTEDYTTPEKTKLAELFNYDPTTINNAIALKVDKVAGKSLIADSEITRLATLSNYTHPANHPPSIITQDASNRFVTDVEKTAWNAKQGALGFTPENVANKSDSYSVSSTATYPNTKALVDGLETKISGTLTTNRIPKSFGTKSIGDSSLNDNGTTVTTNLPIHANSFVKSIGSTNLLLASGSDITQASLPISTATQTALNSKENSFTKNTAFNKPFGITAGTVVEGGTLGSNAYTSTDYFKYETFSADANSLPGNRSAFTYALNAPNNGPIAHFAANGYGMQMNMPHGDNGNDISLRSRNGDGSFWNPWRKMWHDGNFNPGNYLPLSGGTLSGAISGTSATFSSTVTAAPATLPNHAIVKSQLDALATSGSYTPSLSDFANTSARNLVKATYFKIGDIVNVFIHLTVDVITANTDTVVTVSLPINKVNTSLYELGAGVGRLSSVNTNEFTVRTSNVTSTNNIIRLVFKPVSSGTNIVSASFSYAIN